MAAAAAAAETERMDVDRRIGAGVSIRRVQPALAALREGYTIVPHGLDLSLGSADGIDASYLRRLAGVVGAANTPYWSEHIAFTRARGRSIGHLAPLPFTHEALDVLCRKIATARSTIDVPLILENIACPFDVPGADMDEAEFLTRLVDRSGCGLPSMRTMPRSSKRYRQARSHRTRRPSFESVAPIPCAFCQTRVWN